MAIVLCPYYRFIWTKPTAMIHDIKLIGSNLTYRWPALGTFHRTIIDTFMTVNSLHCSRHGVFPFLRGNIQQYTSFQHHRVSRKGWNSFFVLPKFPILTCCSLQLRLFCPNIDGPLSWNTAILIGTRSPAIRQQTMSMHGIPTILHYFMRQSKPSLNDYIQYFTEYEYVHFFRNKKKDHSVAKHRVTDATRIITALLSTGWPQKSKPPPIFQKNRIKDCQRD